MSPRKSTVAVIVNFTGTDNDVGVTEIRRQHRALGMIDVGYHYIISRHGDVQHGRDEALCGNHTPGLNKDSVGILVVAQSHKTMTLQQQSVLAVFSQVLAARYHLQPKDILINGKP